MFPEYYPLVIARSVIKRTGVDFLLPDKTVALTITPGFVRKLITLVNGVRSEREIIGELSAEWEAAQVSELLEYLKQQGVLCNSHNIALHVWQYITNPSLFSHALTSEQVAHKVIESHERNIPSIDFFMDGNARESPLTAMLEQRKSVRAFSSRPVSTPSLIHMLWAGYGKLTCSKKQALMRFGHCGSDKHIQGLKVQHLAFFS
jgi:hypothetical protein